MNVSQVIETQLIKTSFKIEICNVKGQREREERERERE